MPITPHGDGPLVDLRCSDSERDELRTRARGLRGVQLDARELTDLELLAIGGFTPLEGFMTEEQCKSVVNDMHLPGGVPWTVTVTLAAEPGELEGLSEGDEIALRNGDDPVATLQIESLYTADKDDEAKKVYLTEDDAHPGVAAMRAAGDVRIGGPVTVIELPEGEFPKYRLEPAQVRAAFEARDWKTVVAFQTRNPIHRAHEYITKVSL